MKILSNKKYKELINDRKWALKNLLFYEEEIRRLRREREILLHDNDELRNIKRRIEKKLREIPKVNEDNTFTIEWN